MVEAILYESLDNKKVKCKVCNHYCIVSSGKRGICGVRENREGILYSLNYGLTIASAVDPIEKKPLYHFLPGTKIYSLATVGCNLRCAWCQNHNISQSSKTNNDIEGVYITPLEHVQRAIKLRCPSIAYTYSEPTIFLEYALDIMKIAKENGLYNVWVTNGYMSKEALELILPYLDAANVDYKGPDDEVYSKYCGGLAKPVMENMVRMVEKKVHLEVTTLVIPGVNDREDQIQEVASSIMHSLGTDIPWHITRFFPSWKMQSTPVTPRHTLEHAKNIGNSKGIKLIHLGNI